MKATRLICFITGAILAAYAIIMLCINVAIYADYVSYYGLAQVFATIADSFFKTIPWAVLFIVIGLGCGYFVPKTAVASADNGTGEIAKTVEATESSKKQASTIIEETNERIEQPAAAIDEAVREAE